MNYCLTLLLLLLLAMPKPGMAQQQDTALAALLAAAQQAQAGNDFGAAANDYEQAIKLSPDVPELWANLGLMQHEAQIYTEATHSFAHALHLKPSLYVANLFMGVDYVRLGKAKEAIPYLVKAEKMNHEDSLPPLTLGRAYSAEGNFSSAAHAYNRAARISPANSSAWFGLGIARLDEVEQEARRMTEQYQNSSYAKALYAQSLVKQARYTEAGDVYNAILALKPQPPCMQAEAGLLALKQKDEALAATDFQADRSCSLALLGQARLRMDAGSFNDALNLLDSLWKKDRGFLYANLSSFTDGLEPARNSGFQQFLVQQNAAGSVAPDLYQFLSGAFSGQPQVAPSPSAATVRTAQVDYSNGHYAQCASRVKGSLATRNAASLQLLATCAYFTGDYNLASTAAAAITPQSAAALYWSVKANEHLAFTALEKFARLEPNSARSHLLLGDMYRQRRRYDDALSEYQKALAITPNDPAALLGLASSYLGDAQIEKTIQTAQLGLQQTPADPELNLLVGEALVAQHQFAPAEPFLKKALNAKPQMLPHVYALLGEVYAQTGKTQQAIEELKLGLPSDEDGSLHYQLARLYRQTGDNKAATTAIEQMKVLQQRRLQGAVVALKDSHPTNLDDGP